MTSITRSCDITVNGRVAKCGFRIPYRPWDRESVRIKNIAVAKLTRASRRPLVRIRKRGTKRYWLVKPIHKEKLFRNPLLLQGEGIRLKRSKRIKGYRIRRFSSRKPWYAIYVNKSGKKFKVKR